MAADRHRASDWGARLLALSGRFDIVDLTLTDRFRLSGPGNELFGSTKRRISVSDIDVTDLVHDRRLSISEMLGAVARRVGGEGWS